MAAHAAPDDFPLEPPTKRRREDGLQQLGTAATAMLREETAGLVPDPARTHAGSPAPAPSLIPDLGDNALTEAEESSLQAAAPHDTGHAGELDPPDNSHAVAASALAEAVAAAEDVVDHACDPLAADFANPSEPEVDDKSTSLAPAALNPTPHHGQHLLAQPQHHLAELHHPHDVHHQQSLPHQGSLVHQVTPQDQTSNPHLASDHHPQHITTHQQQLHSLPPQSHHPLHHHQQHVLPTSATAAAAGAAAAAAAAAAAMAASSAAHTVTPISMDFAPQTSRESMMAKPPPPAAHAAPQSTPQNAQHVQYNPLWESSNADPAGYLRMTAGLATQSPLVAVAAAPIGLTSPPQPMTAPEDAQTHECSQCEKKFKRKCHLYDHVRRVHEKLRPFQCGQCGLMFPQNSSCERHIKVVHEKRKPHACHLCDKAFGKRYALTVHIQTVHEKRKPFTCTQCNQTFGVRSHLNKHVRVVHEQYKPHHCTECNSFFGERSDLRKHLAAVHKMRS